MQFTGFDPQAIALLARLPDFDGEQFAEVRGLLASGLREPGAACIEAVARAVDSALTVERRASVSPLHHDLRFARANAPRYKDHLLMTAWQGADKKTAPTLWIRIAAVSVGFASGMAFSPEVRRRWREAMGGARGEALGASIAGLEQKHRRCDFTVAGAQL